MTSFIDELISSDDSLANADLESDLVIREMMFQSAQDGSLETLLLAISRGQINTRTPQSIVNAAVHVIGSDRAANRLIDKDLQKRLDFMGIWLNAVAGARPTDLGSPMNAWSERTGPILASCFSTYLGSHDHVAGELIRLGVPTNGIFFRPNEPIWTPVSGARLNTSELDGSVTVFAAAIKNRSRWVEEIASRYMLVDPVVAKIRVGSEECNVNAASYALVLGDIPVLRSVVSGVVKSKKNAKKDIDLWMGDAIDHAEKLGLLDFGPDEVIQGVTYLLALGATLKNPSSFFSRLITLIDIPALADDSLATSEQQIEVASAIQNRTYYLPSAVLYSPKLEEVPLALTAMASMGWNANQPIQPPSDLASESSSGMLPSHLAAFIGNIKALNTLRSLGCDMSAQDKKGLKPIDYARMGSLKSGKSFDMDFAKFFDASYIPRPGDELHFEDQSGVFNDFDLINEEAALASLVDRPDQSSLSIEFNSNQSRNSDLEVVLSDSPEEGGYDYRKGEGDLGGVGQPSFKTDESSLRVQANEAMTEFEMLQKGQADRNRAAQKLNSPKRY